MQAALRQRGIVVNHKKVRRLMREHDLQPRIRRRFIATTDSDHESPIIPNLAKNVTPDGPNQFWVSDITYMTIAAGFVYVAVILDAATRGGVERRRRRGTTSSVSVISSPSLRSR
ncbi:IS3 family transposase [Mesorhizobium sp. M1307]|uniref:IS3 family transposase n=1 Tax=unclassified Mesorhizobium TaxID=325217 RepID=UPI00333A6419